MYTILLLLFIPCSLQLSIQTDFTKPKTVFQNIIAFGDSYTDNGSQTRFYTSKSNNISPSSLHPSMSDIRRASDGPLWIEYLADMYKANLYDFARSGATANNDLILRHTEDMHTQIQAYSRTDTPRRNSAYFLWTGVNDMTELFLKYPVPQQGRTDIMDGIIETISKDLNSLADGGANHIVLMGLIPLESVNMFNILSVQNKQQLKRLVSEYNARLFNVMSLFQSDHPNISATFFNTHQTFMKILGEYSKGAQSPLDCGGGKNCKDLVWWDNLHPSSKTHASIASAVFKKLIELQW